MKVDKNRILMSFKSDLKASEITKKEWDAKRALYVNESYGKNYGNEIEGKSAIVTKDIKKQIEWLIPSVSDAFLSTSDIIKCNPVTFEDSPSARQNELLLNTQFCRKFHRYNFVNKSLRVLATEGTVIVKTGWDYLDEEIGTKVPHITLSEDGSEMIAGMVETTELKVLRNQPTAEVCRNEDIYLDPTCMDDMDKCQFVIHRYETDLSTLRADGRYKNLDKVQYASTSDDFDFVPQDPYRFKFDDNERKKMVVYEYWGNYDVDEDGIVEPIVCSWIGNVIIRLEDNPYPDKKPPFIIVPFNSVPFQMYGEALAENIGDNQKVKTAITRGIIDNMARSNNSQIGLRRGALDMNNRKKFLQGKNFEFNGNPNDFWQGSYNQIPGSVFDMMSMMNNEIESQTGVKSFSGGLNGSSLGSSATAARGTLDASAMRRLHMVRNYAENCMKPLMRKWMSYNAEFLEEEEVVRVTNEQFVPVRRDDLLGMVDIDINISTLEDNHARSQELGFLLQTLGNSMPFEMTQIILAEIIRLGRMPDVEKQVREFQRPQDPAQEQIKQLEMQKLVLQNKLLEAEINDLVAKADENRVDIKVKMAKALREEAAARKLSSETDKLDLDFIKADGQFDDINKYDMRKEDMNFKMQETSAKLAAQLEAKRMDMDHQSTEKERDRQHQASIMAFQASHQDKNIGVR